MGGPTDRTPKDEAKAARLKAALKANMGRRKAQAKARGADPADANHAGRRPREEGERDG